MLQAAYLPDAEALAAEVARIQPSEVLHRDALPELGVRSRRLDSLAFDPALGFNQLTRHFGTRNLSGFGVADGSPVVGVTAAVLEYAKLTQCQDLAYIDQLRLVSNDETVALDAQSRRNLEIDRRLNGEEDATLYALFNTTRTPMGARLLRRWLNAPSRNRRRIGERQAGVAALIDVAYENLRSQLSEVGDMERVVSRIALGSASPRDLGRLRSALDALPGLVSGLPKEDPASARLAATAWPPTAAQSSRSTTSL